MKKRGRKGTYPDLIAESSKIRDAIVRQISLNQMSISDVARDSEFYNYPISRSKLSEYWNHARGLTQRDILWLCIRYGIVIKLSVYVEDVNKLTLKSRIKNFMEKWNVF